MMENKQNNPLVSIVLPMYNAAEYIKECVDSILMQTYSDFELLIIDDGSTDDSIQLVETYKDSRIRLIKNEHNYIASLNLGLKESCGRYIARMDADDRMKPQRIERQAEIMESMSEIIICCSHVQRLGGTELFNAGIKGKFKYFKQLLLVGNFICHPSVMMRKDFLEEHKIRYLQGYPYAEDYKLWTEIANIGGKIYVIEDPLLEYRISINQVSRIHKEEQVNVALKIRNEHLNNLIENEGAELRQDLINLYKALVELNERSLIEDETIFSIFYQIFTTADLEK